MKQMNQDSTRTPTTSFGEEELCPLIRNILPVICVSSPQSGGVSTPKSKREVTGPAGACQPNLPLRVLIELQYSRHNLQDLALLSCRRTHIIDQELRYQPSVDEHLVIPLPSSRVVQLPWAPRRRARLFVILSYAGKGAQRR